MDNQRNYQFSFVYGLTSLALGLGFMAGALNHLSKPAYAKSAPQWVAIQSEQGSNVNGNNVAQPSPTWQVVKPQSNTSVIGQNPLVITQAAAEETSSAPTFVPLHRRRGSGSFLPSLLPIEGNEEGQSESEEKKRIASPGTSIMVPSAYGSKWGGMGIGIGGQERVRFDEKSDGTLGISLGLGDPQKNVGLQLGLGLTNLSDIFDRGDVSWKLHRQIDPNNHIAIGGTNLVNWGGGDGGSSGYGVYTRRFQFKEDPSQALGELVISMGLGGGQFRKEADINAGNDYLGFFGGAALRVAEPINAIAEWTGQDLTIGLSIAPFPQVPVVITPALTDITGTAGDGTRFILGVGYGFSL